MAIGLPVNLGAVADAADRRGGAGRFALDAVYVELKQADRLVYPPAGQEGPPDLVTDRTYTVAATDTKRLVVVEGECGNPDDVPGLEAVRTAPNGGTKGLIPLKVFKKTFADAAKATGRQTPAARQVLVALSEVQATLGYSDFESTGSKATTMTCVASNVRLPWNMGRSKSPAASWSFECSPRGENAYLQSRSIRL